MDNDFFLSSAKLGIKSDDQIFLARFENNFNLEPRHLPVARKKWAVESIVELIGYAAAGALCLSLLLPSMSEWFIWARQATFHQIAEYGLSPNSAAVIMAALGCLAALVWPAIRA